jgi:hypothetical protein
MAIYDYLDKNWFLSLCLLFGLFIIINKVVDVLEFRRDRKMRAKRLKAALVKKTVGTT